MASDALKELVIKSVLNAAAGVDLPGRSREQAVRESVDLLIQGVTGMCQRTGNEPFDGNTCGCVPCRAWRTEKAEGKVAGLEEDVIKADQRAEQLDEQLAIREQVITQVQESVEELSAELASERETHEETGEQLARARALADRNADTVAVLTKKLSDASAVIVKQDVEVSRLAAIESKVQAFVLGLSVQTEEV